MQEDNIAIRLKFLIQELGINNSVFAENCGISRATLSQMLTGRNKKISDIIIGQIHKAYPALSIMWLLFNEGDMWLGTSASHQNPDNKLSDASISFEDNIDDISSPSNISNSKNSFINQNSDSNRLQHGLENPDFRMDAHGNPLKSKENSLNEYINDTQTSAKKQVNNPDKSSCDFNKIENFAPKNRKVVQITIYYDDSTFESFYPKNR